MKDDYTTNSHYRTHTFLFRKVGRMYFLTLGVKGLKLFHTSIEACLNITKIFKCHIQNSLIPVVFRASSPKEISLFFKIRKEEQKTMRIFFQDQRSKPDNSHAGFGSAPEINSSL